MTYAVQKTEGRVKYAVQEVPFTATFEPPSGGGVGGVTSVGGVANIEPQLFSQNTRPLGVFWSTPAAAILEGEGRVFELRITRAQSRASIVDIELDPASTIDPATISFPPRVTIPQGWDTAQVPVTTTNTAGGSNDTTALLRLVEVPFQTLGEEDLVLLQPRAGQGPVVLDIAVLNEVTAPNPPTWNFGVSGGATQVNEFSFNVPFTIQLDKPALSPLSFALAASGTAVEGVDYEPIPNAVQIGTGESQATFPISFPDNSVDPPVNPVLTVTGTATGDVIDGATTAFDVTILNNDEGGVGGSGTPRLNFASTQFTVGEGQSVTVQAFLTVGGSLVALTESLTVPIGFTGDLSEFTVDWGVAGAGAMYFEAGESTASFTVTSRDNDTPGQVQFSILELTGQTAYIIGPRSVLMVNSVTGEFEPTTFMLPAMDGRRMMKSLVAVSPPNSVLPRYRLTTGEECQVVGHRKNADDLWTSAYIYGLAPGAESIAGEANALGLELADGSETLPPENGNFIPELQLEFRTRLANAGLFTTNTLTQGPGLPGPTSASEWTSPNGVWPQTGADVVREDAYLMRPLRVGATRSLFNTSGDTCGYIELCGTRIAGDGSVVLYEGQWVNGAWASQDQPNVSTFEENPYTDGEVYLQSIEVEAPPGWVIDFVDEHPAQEGSGQQSAALLRPRAENYFFGTCQPYTFWFAVRQAGDAAAEARARDYVRCKNVAWAVGTYGSTRNRIWGEAGDYTVDWGRANLGDQPTSNNVGWRTIRKLGEDRWNGSFGGGGLEQDWVDGGIYPFSAINSEYREGWMHPTDYFDGGQSSGVGIYGTSGLVPWWTWWYQHRMDLHKVMCRTRLAYKDMISGQAPWWWNLSENVGGTWKASISGAQTTRAALNRHYHFTTIEEGPDPTNGMQETNPRYLRAPLTRPWNNPDSGREDPQKARYKEWELIKFTHMARERQGYIDGWWGMRSFVAYKSYEMRATAITRLHHPLEPEEHPSNFQLNISNMGRILPILAANPVFAGSGQYPVDGNSDVRAAGALRALAWCGIIASGFYSIADEGTRASLRGQGAAAARGGRGWFNDLAAWWEFMAEPCGVLARERTNSASPNPYSQGTVGETDYVARRGANVEIQDFQPGETVPGWDGVVPFAQSHVIAFQMYFTARAVEALRANVFGQFSPFNNFLERTLRWHSYFITSSQNFSPGFGVTSMPFAIILSAGPAPIAEVGNGQIITPPDKTTLAEYLAGDMYWHHKNISTGGDFGFDSHASKVGWTACAHLRGLGEQAGIDIAKNVLSQQTATLQDFAEWLLRGGGDIQSSMTSQGSAQRIRNYGERTFLIPLLAEVLNLIS